MPGWEHAPGDTVTIEMDTPTPGTDSVTTATYTTTTTYSAHMTSVVNGAGIPVVMTANANAASSTMLSAIGSTGAHGVMGTGSLGMITVMIMVYNLCVGLGLGVMLWKVSLLLSGAPDAEWCLTDSACRAKSTGRAT